MRKRSKQTSPISVHAVAGTEVVLLGLNADEEATKGLLGFSIYKRKGTSGKFWPLPSGGRTFLGEQDEEAGDTTRSNSETEPIQAFMWSDYVVDRGKTYSYRVVPVYGIPGKLVHDTKHAVEVTVTTEDPAKQAHGVYFNRGVAGSRAYAKKFGAYRQWYLDSAISEFVTQKRREEALAENAAIRAEELERLETIVARPFVRPEKIPHDAPEGNPYEWLSRGLEEAMLEFIGQANKGDKLRAAVYEFTHRRVIEAFVAALERGVDVRIVYHAKRDSVLRLKGAPKKKSKEDPAPPKPETITNWTGDEPRPDDECKDARDSKPMKKYVVEDRNKDGETRAAESALAKVGLTTPDTSPHFRKLLKAFNEMMIERTETGSLSHNKFIVLFKKNKPTQVWTGSTNFTEGGIYGQSNVGHVVRDEKVAKQYSDYWKQLSADTKIGELRKWTVAQQPDLEGPAPAGITTVFSPRAGSSKNPPILKWYAKMLEDARHSVFFTAAFSVADQFFDVVKDVKKVNGQPYEGEPYLRYLMLEGTGGHLEKKFPEIQACTQNRLAWGGTFKRRKKQDEDEPIETLTGLNSHVSYLHTKYMLVDPLSNDPLVISGSANFSVASTNTNDENMLIIRGNTRVADIFLTEFMRLFNHFQTRNKSNILSDAEYKAARRLRPNDSWTEPYYDSKMQEYQERLLFS